MANLSWLPGQEGGKVVSPQGVPQPTMLDYTLLPYMAAMMNKKKEDRADWRTAFGALVPAGYLPSEGKGDFTAAGQGWEYSPYGTGALDAGIKAATLQDKLLDLDPRARMLKSMSGLQNLPFVYGMLSKMSPEDLNKMMNVVGGFGTTTSNGNESNGSSLTKNSKREKAKKLLQSGDLGKVFTGTDEEVDIFLGRNPDYK